MIRAHPARAVGGRGLDGPLACFLADSTTGEAGRLRTPDVVEELIERSNSSVPRPVLEMSSVMTNGPWTSTGRQAGRQRVELSSARADLDDGGARASRPSSLPSDLDTLPLTFCPRRPSSYCSRSQARSASPVQDVL